MREPVVRQLFIFIFFTALPFFVLPAHGAVPLPRVSSGAVDMDKVPPDQAELVLAGLSDEQVRGVLIAELRKQEAALDSENHDNDAGPVAMVVNWLHLIDGEASRDGTSRLEEIFGYIGRFPAELMRIARGFGDNGPLAAWRNIGLLLLVFLVAFGVEGIFNIMTAGFRRSLSGKAVPDLTGALRFWAGVIHILPSLVAVLVFGVATLLLFIVTPADTNGSVRLLFMAILLVILFMRLSRLLSVLVFAPMSPHLRLLPVSDAAAVQLDRLARSFLYFVGVGLTLIALARELGAAGELVVLLALFLGTLLLLLVGWQVVRYRSMVAEYILSTDHGEEGRSWFVRQLASFWHLPAMLYLAVVWLVFFFQQVSGSRQDNGALLLSLLAAPIFLIFDRIAQWVVGTTVRTMRIYTDTDDSRQGEGQPEERLTAEQREEQLIARLGRFVRLAVLAVVVIWILSLWGYHLPYAAAVTRAVFESLVTMALALLVWRVTSNYIEGKIQEMTPEEDEDDGQDDEWGAAAQRGRGYTLLPMVRKFIATVLVVMVSLIILSAIGVDIAPLLAGAGVVGIALGFGAQKLVSDVLSGFFFLIDDAFRVGEYLKAGSVSGAVEAITLRNVMLRHHRGMLQIVPYSELGPITNFMRGGIVVKFNLEFPYDTDIDKVRKIIKRVGQAMLQDPEFGDDFIKPVKSQGVREITSSVMVIRVKFTAKPGTHFVIRREAYRRITEALAAKGIHYAHRKVIVELPRDEDEHPDPKKIAEAGAAAAVAEEEARKSGSGGSAPSGPAMPGM